jgi:hypothetical protein
MYEVCLLKYFIDARKIVIKLVKPDYQQ